MLRKLKTFLLFSVLICTFLSCKARTAPKDEHIARGETVNEFAKGYRCIFRDKHNNYWFGSEAEGVYRYSAHPDARGLKKTLVRFTKKDGLCDDRVRAIQEDRQGNVYFTTENGISKFDGKTFTTLQVVANNDPNEWKAGPDDIWFRGEPGTHGPRRYDGKYLYALKFPKHEMEDNYNRQFPGTPIDPYDLYHIYKDKKGNIWFGTGAFGIYRFDGESLSSMYEDHLTYTTASGGAFCIRSIFEDRHGKFWICNTKYRYNILPGGSKDKGKGFINYTREDGIGNIKGDPLGDDRIYFQSIAEDSKGDLWLQTYGGGIWQYNGTTMKNYPVKYGTEDIKVISMYRDNNGGLWLATQEHGIYTFNGKTFEQFKP